MQVIRVKIVIEGKKYQVRGICCLSVCLLKKYNWQKYVKIVCLVDWVGEVVLCKFSHEFLITELPRFLTTGFLLRQNFNIRHTDTINFFLLCFELNTQIYNYSFRQITVNMWNRWREKSDFINFFFSSFSTKNLVLILVLLSQIGMGHS